MIPSSFSFARSEPKVSSKWFQSPLQRPSNAKNGTQVNPKWNQSRPKVSPEWLPRHIRSPKVTLICLRWLQSDSKVTPKVQMSFKMTPKSPQNAPESPQRDRPVPQSSTKWPFVQRFCSKKCLSVPWKSPFIVPGPGNTRNGSLEPWTCFINQ